MADRHLTFLGVRIMTIKIHKLTFGPGARPNGARFRNEVLVCSRCHRVIANSEGFVGMLCHGEHPTETTRRGDNILALYGPLARDRWIRTARGTRSMREIVPALCGGKHFPPIEDQGWRYYH